MNGFSEIRERIGEYIMKKLLLVLLLAFIIPFITACEEKPHEECFYTWDEHMETRQIYFVSYTAYVLETDFGDVTISKKIYEASLNQEYKEICIMVNPNATNEFLGATLIDGSPIDQDLIDEIHDQVVPDEYQEEEEE